MGVGDRTDSAKRLFLGFRHVQAGFLAISEYRRETRDGGNLQAVPPS
jgi:hypothetical protein